MPHPTDHGLAVVKDEPGGTHSVAICAEVIRGAPARAYAAYYNAEVHIEPGIVLKEGHASRHTTEIVEVSQSPDGAVWIRRPRAIPA
jgi:hypothetical protein